MPFGFLSKEGIPSREEKEKEFLIKILVIEDNQEYIKDFEKLEEKIKTLNLPIIFEKVKNMKEFEEKKKEGWSGVLVDVFIPEDEKKLGMMGEFEKIYKWKGRTTLHPFDKEKQKEFEENHPSQLLMKFLSETDKEKKKRILEELKEFFSIISGLKIGERTIEEELKDVSEEDELALIRKYSSLLEIIPEDDLQKEIDKKLRENTPGIKILEELKKVPTVIVTSLGHHGMKLKQILEYAREKKFLLLRLWEVMKNLKKIGRWD